jgi:hypothetical protein
MPDPGEICECLATAKSAPVSADPLVLVIGRVSTVASLFGGKAFEDWVGEISLGKVRSEGLILNSCPACSLISLNPNPCRMSRKHS